MRILVDTDVLLDVALNRAPHADSSSRLVDHLQANRGTGYVAWHTISNVYYLTGSRGRDTASRDFIVDLSWFLEVAQPTAAGLRFAAGLAMKDFEDAMQVAAAAACGAQVIATRNVRDFASSPIRAESPARLLVELGKSES